MDDDPLKIIVICRAKSFFFDGDMFFAAVLKNGSHLLLDVEDETWANGAYIFINKLKYVTSRDNILLRSANNLANIQFFVIEYLHFLHQIESNVKTQGARN